MRSIWIGLAHLRPERGCELIDRPAYVQVVASVEDADEFKAQLQEAAAHYRLHVLGIEDLEPLKDRLHQQEVAAEIREKAIEAEATGYLRFGTFNTYPAE